MAIVTALTAFHIGLAFMFVFAALGFFAWRNYKKICRQSAANRALAEADELEDCWASFPPKWKPPVAEEKRAA